MPLFYEPVLKGPKRNYLFGTQPLKKAESTKEATFRSDKS